MRHVYNIPATPHHTVIQSDCNRETVRAISSCANYTPASERAIEQRLGFAQSDNKNDELTFEEVFDVPDEANDEDKI